MTNDYFLLGLVEPFIKEKDLTASFPLHFGYRKDLGLVDRYCALFGFADPVVFYLKKNDRQPWFVTNFNKGKIISRNKKYTVSEFNKTSLPTVGDNGYLIKKKHLLESKNQNEKFLHSDIFIDIMKYGHKKFSIVNDVAVVHLVDKSLISLARRRSYYTSFESPLKIKRRYLVFNPLSIRDLVNMALFILFTLTVVQPLLVSFRGYLKIRDSAWFLHPIACLLFLIYYSKTYTMLIFEQSIKKIK